MAGVERAVLVVKRDNVTAAAMNSSFECNYLDLVVYVLARIMDFIIHRFQNNCALIQLI